MSKSACFGMFVLGAAIGSAVTYYLLNQRYIALRNEEVESLKREHGWGPTKTEKKEEEKEEKPKEAPKEYYEQPSIKEYAEMLKRNNYTTYSKDKTGGSEDMRRNLEPCVITPDEFGEIDDYEKSEFTYYADGVLADDNDEIVDDADELVGSDFADHFGEFEEDSVFIRNDDKEHYYEILKDTRTYEDVVGASKPNPVEV